MTSVFSNNGNALGMKKAKASSNKREVGGEQNFWYIKAISYSIIVLSEYQ